MSEQAGGVADDVAIVVFVVAITVTVAVTVERVLIIGVGPAEAGPPLATPVLRAQAPVTLVGKTLEVLDNGDGRDDAIVREGLEEVEIGSSLGNQAG